jgi:hypothetical protein
MLLLVLAAAAALATATALVAAARRWARRWGRKLHVHGTGAGSELRALEPVPSQPVGACIRCFMRCLESELLLEEGAVASSWAGISFACCYACSNYSDSDQFHKACAERRSQLAKLPACNFQFSSGCYSSEVLEVAHCRYEAGAMTLALAMDRTSQNCIKAHQYIVDGYFCEVREAWHTAHEFIATQTVHLANVSKGVALFLVCRRCSQRTQQAQWTYNTQDGIMYFKCPSCRGIARREDNRMELSMTDLVTGSMFSCPCSWPEHANWFRDMTNWLPCDFMKDGWLSELVVKTAADILPISDSDLRSFVLRSVIKLSMFLVTRAQPTVMARSTDSVFDVWPNLVELLAHVLAGAKWLGVMLNNPPCPGSASAIIH